jgi:hypothetical protein
MASRRIPTPELPPCKPCPDVEYEPCNRCWTRGSWYACGAEETTVEVCVRCCGEGWLLRTHPKGAECPNQFPDSCSSCGCACEVCETSRSDAPRWEEFERQHREYPGNGNPGKFVAWGTEPFRRPGGATSRFAIFQPWSGAGLVWHRCFVGMLGRVVSGDSPYDRSQGAFYDGMTGGAYTGDAIADASASAERKMHRILAV